MDEEKRKRLEGNGWKVGSVKEFLYWDDPDSYVEGYLGKAPEPRKPAKVTNADRALLKAKNQALKDTYKPKSLRDKKISTTIDGKGLRLYKIFKKLSSRERKRFLKLIENEL